jgi:RimJ/RimL family protein N-acetyltransferase
MDDWVAVHDWARREDVCRYQAWGPNTPEETRAFVQTAVDEAAARPRIRYVYAVLLGSRVIGIGELRRHGDHQGEIGYGVHPVLWGRGVGTAVARRLLAIGFEELRLHRVFATCDPRNVASGRVLQKIRMTHEGRMRETVLIRDGWRDSDLYAMLEQEYERRPPAPGD